MPKEEFTLYFTQGDPRHRSPSTNKRFYESRFIFWKSKGLPKEIANWLAKRGFPVHPRTDTEKQDRERITGLIKTYKHLVYRAKLRGDPDPIGYALDIIKEKNEDNSESDRYNLFSLGSP